jgi:tetratricopeptide (TPR) repeat protein
MSTAVQLAPAPAKLPPVPWRDPHTVPPQELRDYVGVLERACAENPQSADLRTCLGMAYAMQYEAYKSLDVLEEAVRIDPEHFWAQVKLAELWYRLRALPRAEQEMLLALELANTPMEAALARKHLQEIRRLMREGTQKPAWTKPLGTPAAALVLLVVIVSILMVMR